MVSCLGEIRSKQWEADKKYADSFRPQIEAIVRKLAWRIISFEDSTQNDDQMKAIDYVIQIKGGQICCRVRRAVIPWRDFTIRVSRPTKARTELEKLKAGFGDWYLYCWEDRGTISEYIFVDLLKAREANLFSFGINKNNKDGSVFRTIAIPCIQKCGALIEHWKI